MKNETKNAMVDYVTFHFDRAAKTLAAAKQRYSETPCEVYKNEITIAKRELETAKMMFDEIAGK